MPIVGVTLFCSLIDVSEPKIAFVSVSSINLENLDSENLLSNLFKFVVIERNY